ADEKPVVENIVVRQGRAFGKASRTRGELDVDRLVELQLRCKRGDALGFRRATTRHDLGEAEGSRMPTVAQKDDRAERRQPRRLQLARLRLAEFRRQFAKNADIVRSLEPLGEDQRLAADLVKRVFEFGDAI